MRAFNRIILLSLLFFYFNNQIVNVSLASEKERDYWPTSWIQKTPRDVNMSQSILNDMITYIENQKYAIDSILIVKDGYLILEEYLNPSYNQSVIHPIFSCTKSIMSMFIGMAIDEGYISGIDQKIMDFFPNQTYQNPDSRKEDITIGHLLTMTSGLEWYEWDFENDTVYEQDTFGELLQSENWVQFILDRPIITDPGKIFNYNTGDYHLLSAILNNATRANKLTYNDFVLNVLGIPLAIMDAGWQGDPQGIPFGGTGLYLMPRDLAKIGYLYLNNGTWDEKQLVSNDWVNYSTKLKTTISHNRSYGHGWWVNPELNIYYASGYAGQLIIPIPSYDLVLVFSSYDTVNWPYFDLLTNFVIPSIESGADSQFELGGIFLIGSVFSSFLILGVIYLYKERIKEILGNLSAMI